MEPFTTVGILYLVLTAGAIYGSTRSAWKYARGQRAGRRAATWRGVAIQAGLSEVEISGSVVLRGRAGPLTVVLTEYQRDSGQGTRIDVHGVAYRSHTLALRSEAGDAALQRRWRAGDGIRLGEPAFDHLVAVKGSPEVAYAVLDAPTRERLVALAGGGVRVQMEDDVLSLEIPRRHPWPGAVEALRTAIELGQRLRLPEDLPARLARNARHDPLPGVRLRNLEALLEAFPRDPHSRSALRAALTDPHDELRLRAALALGKEGQATLLELACGESTHDEQAARAIESLGSDLATERVATILVRARHANRLATVRACVGWMGEHGGPEMVPLLAPLVASANEELAGAAARALAAAGPDAEGPLLERLASGSSAEVLAAVAGALGRVGSAAAVMPLRAAAERVQDRELRREVSAAIAEIHTRLQGAEPGQLSLTAEPAGQVSLAGDDDARGQLSLPREPDER